jgi:hypothetical protein
VAFPKIHDLDELGTLLEDAGQRIPEPFAGLLEFTDFAVAFRHDAFPDLECDMDRRDAIRQVGDLLKHVQNILAHTAP